MTRLNLLVTVKKVTRARNSNEREAEEVRDGDNALPLPGYCTQKFEDLETVGKLADTNFRQGLKRDPHKVSISLL